MSYYDYYEEVDNDYIAKLYWPYNTKPSLISKYTKYDLCALIKSTFGWTGENSCDFMGVTNTGHIFCKYYAYGFPTLLIVEIDTSSFPWIPLYYYSYYLHYYTPTHYTKNINGLNGTNGVYYALSYNPTLYPSYSCYVSCTLDTVAHTITAINNNPLPIDRWDNNGITKISGTPESGIIADLTLEFNDNPCLIPNTMALFSGPTYNDLIKTNCYIKERATYTFSDYQTPPLWEDTYTGWTYAGNTSRIIGTCYSLWFVPPEEMHQPLNSYLALVEYDPITLYPERYWVIENYMGMGPDIAWDETKIEDAIEILSTPGIIPNPLTSISCTPMAISGIDGEVLLLYTRRDMCWNPEHSDVDPIYVPSLFDCLNLFYSVPEMPCDYPTSIYTLEKIRWIEREAEPEEEFGIVTFGGRDGSTYVGTQDTWLRGQVPLWNYGIATNFYIGYYSLGKGRAVIAFDLKAFDDAKPNAEILGARLILHILVKGGADSDLNIYAALQPWGGNLKTGNWDVNEGDKNGVTASNNEPNWNWFETNTNTWNSVGAGATLVGIDGDNDNPLSDDYNGILDRGYTSLGSVTVTSGNTDVTIPLNITGLKVLRYQKEHAGYRYGFVITYSEVVGNHVQVVTGNHVSQEMRPQLEIDYRMPSHAMGIIEYIDGKNISKAATAINGEPWWVYDITGNRNSLYTALQISRVGTQNNADRYIIKYDRSGTELVRKQLSYLDSSGTAIDQYNSSMQMRGITGTDSTNIYFMYSHATRGIILETFNSTTLDFIGRQAYSGYDDRAYSFLAGDDIYLYTLYSPYSVSTRRVALQKRLTSDFNTIVTSFDLSTYVDSGFWKTDIYAQSTASGTHQDFRIFGLGGDSSHLFMVGYNLFAVLPDQVGIGTLYEFDPNTLEYIRHTALCELFLTTISSALSQIISFW
jgi:hypothetical protein